MGRISRQKISSQKKSSFPFDNLKLLSSAFILFFIFFSAENPINILPMNVKFLRVDHFYDMKIYVYIGQKE